MMGAGKRDKRVSIQEKTVTIDNIGNQTETWVTIATVWAAIAPLNGREYWAARQINAEATTRVTIAYRRRVTPEHRLLFGSRVLEIIEIVNPSEGNVELVLLCKEAILGG
jgi:SPP1 family predicted phage head-tail adaptor